MRGILLAAGRGIRFGANKLLHPLADGTPMGLAAALNLSRAMADTLAVVNGDDAELALLLEGIGMRVTICPNADAGMGTSLAWGVAQSREADGWLIALADMPWIKPLTIQSIARAVASPHLIAAPVFQGRRGHPVAFGQDYRQALLASSGDQGARHLLGTFAANLVLVPSEDTGVLRDIDSRGQLVESSPYPGRRPREIP
jgi:molybdenum cofactor cytidylyltransferase